MAAVVPIGLLGLVVGGYLSGVVARVPAGEPVLVGGRRAWPARDGGSGPLLLAGWTALVFALLAARFGYSAELPAYLYAGAAGVALAAIDLEHHRLPNALTIPSYVIGIGLLGVAAASRGSWSDLLRALGGMAALYVIYYLLMLVHSAGMGFGDVKLSGVLGLYLGWLGWAEVVLGGFLGFAFGAVAGLVLMLARRVTRKSNVPFGPAMLLGALAMVVAGEPIVHWYLGGISG